MLDSSSSLLLHVQLMSASPRLRKKKKFHVFFLYYNSDKTIHQSGGNWHLNYTAQGWGFHYPKVSDSWIVSSKAPGSWNQHASRGAGVSRFIYHSYFRLLFNCLVTVDFPGLLRNPKIHSKSMFTVTNLALGCLMAAGYFNIQLDILIYAVYHAARAVDG